MFWQGADTIDDAGRAARQRAEELAARQGAELDRLDREDANVQRAAGVDRGPSGPPALGDNVAVASLGGKLARVMELRGDEAVVAGGQVKMTVLIKTLTRAAVAAEIAVPWRGDLPEVEVKSEVDMRGFRVDEAESALLQALDAAIRADLRSLRIIHGKGTGALRERVTEMLQKDTRVKGFRLGAWNEGGTGVTIVDLG